MITREQALWALDNMDDYARMAGVIALGPMNVLRQYIWQSAPVAEQATKDAAEDAELLDWLAKHAGEIYGYGFFWQAETDIVGSKVDAASLRAAIRAARAAERKA